MNVVYIPDDNMWDPVDVNPVSHIYVPIIQPDHSTNSVYKHKKRRKLNPIGENIWLRPDGSILFEMDVIIKLQLRVRERLWAPDGVLAKRLCERYEACPLGTGDHQ